MAPFLNKLRCLKSSEPRGQRSRRLKNTAQNHTLLNGKVGSDHSGKQGTDKKHDLRDGLHGAGLEMQIDVSARMLQRGIKIVDQNGKRTR